MLARSSRVRRSSSATKRVAGADLEGGGSEPRALPTAGSPGRSEGLARGGRSEADTTGEAYRKNSYLGARSIDTHTSIPSRPSRFPAKASTEMHRQGCAYPIDPCRSKSVFVVR